MGELPGNFAIYSQRRASGGSVPDIDDALNRPHDISIIQYWLVTKPISIGRQGHFAAYMQGRYR